MEGESRGGLQQAGDFGADLGIKVGKDELILPMQGINFAEIFHGDKFVIILREEQVQLDIKILRVKGEGGPIKIYLEVGREAFQVGDLPGRFDLDQAVDRPAVALLVEKGKIRPLTFYIVKKIAKTGLGIEPETAVAFIRVECQRRICPFQLECANIVHDFIWLIDVDNLLKLKSNLDGYGQLQHALTVGLSLAFQHFGSIDLQP